MIQGNPAVKRFRYALYKLLCLLLIICGACATTPSAPTTARPVRKGEQAPSLPELRSEGERRSADYAVITALPSDSYESLARTYLGDAKLAYLIAEFNRNDPIVPGQEVVIPLQPVNPGGLYPDGYETVPILCYHQLSSRKSSKSITVSEETFDRQMAYLKKNGYNVITLKQFLDFIEGRRRPPRKSVLITIDDGWKTARTVAYPILKKYGFTAVLFLYTDLIKTNSNPLTLSWDDANVLKQSGVFEIECHTVTHSDLTRVSDDELQKELRESRRIIFAKTGVTPEALAYPDGVFNRRVIDAMKNSGYKAGFTVVRGPNAFFHNPYSLNRSMVHNSEKMSDFIKLLDTFKKE